MSLSKLDFISACAVLYAALVICGVIGYFALGLMRGIWIDIEPGVMGAIVASGVAIGAARLITSSP